MNKREWLEKADYEGVFYALTEYGLSEIHLDDDVDDEFRDYVRIAVAVSNEAQKFVSGIEEMIENEDFDE